MFAERPVLNSALAAAPVYAAGTSVEEAVRKSGLQDIVKLASNESPLGPSPRAVAAVRACLRTLHRYPVAGDDALRARIARQVGGGIGPENVAVANGGTEVLSLIAQGFLAPGDEAIFCPPTFPLYEIFTRRRGATAVACPLRMPGGAYDVDAILRAVGPATRVLFLCSPVNPTGTLLTRDGADRLLRGLPQRVVTVFDESYRDFVDDTEAAESLPYVRAGRTVLSVRSFSKSYGLAGLRVGYALAPEDLARYLERGRNPFHVSAPALAGALAALDDERYLDRVRRIVRAERRRMVCELDHRGLAPLPSQANFVFFRPGCPPDLLYQELLARGIVIRPTSFFYVPDGVRVTVGTRAHNTRFLAALDEVLPPLRARSAR